jgi:hypothetical protein
VLIVALQRSKVEKRIGEMNVELDGCESFAVVLHWRSRGPDETMMNKRGRTVQLWRVADGRTRLFRSDTSVALTRQSLQHITKVIITISIAVGRVEPISTSKLAVAIVSRNSPTSAGAKFRNEVKTPGPWVVNWNNSNSATQYSGVASDIARGKGERRSR